MSDEMQIKIQETPLSARRLEDVIERKEIATLLCHSSVVRTSTRVEGAVERKELPSLFLQSSVARASTGMEGALEGKELDTLLLHSSVASALTRVKVVQSLEYPPGCKVRWK